MPNVSRKAKTRGVVWNYVLPTERQDVCTRCVNSRPCGDGKRASALWCSKLKRNVSKMGKCNALRNEGAADPLVTIPPSTEDDHEPE